MLRRDPVESEPPDEPKEGLSYTLRVPAFDSGSAGSSPSRDGRQGLVTTLPTHAPRTTGVASRCRTRVSRNHNSAAHSNIPRLTAFVKWMRGVEVLRICICSVAKIGYLLPHN